jgi:hypothetical protein
MTKHEDDSLRETREWLEGLIKAAEAKVTAADYRTRADQGGPAANIDIERAGLRYGITIKPLP